MPKICYVPKKFRRAALEMIDQANHITAEYRAQGLQLTLRQLYYQYVARGLLANRDTEYDRLGSIINDARLAGLVDWNDITDRTRYLRTLSHWDTPEDLVGAAAAQYRRDMWGHQPCRLEAWIEKDALIGVIEGVCQQYDVPYFSCRGYTSATEVWAAAQRLLVAQEAGQQPIILHLGDHDPSGIDMTRDIRDRLALFMGSAVPVRRLALNREQIDRYGPPPNPAKTTDSRYAAYIAEHGHESWELDALEPRVLSDLVRQAILQVRDPLRWRDDEERITRERAQLSRAADHWESVMGALSRTLPLAERAQTARPLGPRGRPANGYKGSDATFSAKGKRDGDYLTARIARDHPAIWERMKAGEFRSVRAAAIAAGIVRPPRAAAPVAGDV